MKSFADIIDAFGYTALAKELGKPEGTVSSWKTRDFIPPAYWDWIVREASTRRIRGVTHERLAKLAARRHAEQIAEAS